MGPKRTPLTVIIPAHNEASAVDSCLRAVLDDPKGDQLEIIVVANGCSDDTAARARRHSGVTVIETETGSKALALELGRQASEPGIRVYLDADIIVSPGAIGAVADLVDRPGVEGGAPAIRLEAPADATTPLRHYLDVWTAAPYFQQNLIGSGFFALSQEAQDRIGAWPSLVADDLVALTHLAPQERAVAREHWFRHEVPRSIRDMYRVEIRREAGRAEFAEWAARERREIAEEGAGGRWLLQVARSPRRWFGVALFVGVKALAKRQGAKVARSGQISWNHDRSPDRSQSDAA